MTAVMTVVMLDAVEVGTVAVGVVGDAQEVKVLANLAISLSLYLMIVKCQNPTLCLLFMTCEWGTVHLAKRSPSTDQ